MVSRFLLSFVVLHVFISRGVLGATFTLVNKCDYTVWPGVLSNAGSGKLVTTGFELTKGSSRLLQAPSEWSGRFWGRTGCQFDGSGQGSCRTGDCGSSQVECHGSGATPPATLAEFTLGGSGGQDFYDVSLVDGFNVPMVVVAEGGSGSCAPTGCMADLNQRCPTELRVGDDSGDGSACKSACQAFGRPEFCCSGAYANPGTCKPSYYAGLFKTACPRAYSYAFDDPTSTFTCTGASYTITFCSSSVSQKSSSDSPSKGTATGVILSDEGWLASLAIADALPSYRFISTAGLVYTATAAIIATAISFLL